MAPEAAHIPISTMAMRKVVGLPAWLESHWQNCANFMMLFLLNTLHMFH